MGAFSGVRGCFGDVLVAFGFVWECSRFEKTEQQENGEYLQPTTYNVQLFMW